MKEFDYKFDVEMVNPGRLKMCAESITKAVEGCKALYAAGVSAEEVVKIIGTRTGEDFGTAELVTPNDTYQFMLQIIACAVTQIARLEGTKESQSN